MKFASLCFFSLIAFSSIVHSSPRPENRVKAQNLTGRVPIYFEPNMGQFDPQVRFVARGAKYQAWITDHEMVLGFSRQLPDKAGALNVQLPKFAVAQRVIESDVVRIRFGQMKPRSATGLDKLESYSNYFIGNDPKKWRSEVPNFARAKLEEVYPGIDIVFYGKGREIEYDLILKPGADPGAISLRFDGPDMPRIDSIGNLILMTRTGTLTHRAPVAFQGKRLLQVNARFDQGRLGFDLSSFDRTRSVTIDPVLEYSTYLGGSGGQDVATDIAVDAVGNSYVVGRTDSLNFPVLNAIQPGNSGGSGDVFIMKLSSLGIPIYSTYLGGSGQEAGEGIAIDSIGSAFVTGLTQSANFPSVSAAQPALAGGTDVFVTRLNSAGSAIQYSTYLGGSNYELGLAVAVDSLGSAFVVGHTNSANYPTVSAFQSTIAAGVGDAFVTKVSPLGSSFLYSTFLGGGSLNSSLGTYDEALAVVVDATGSAYVTGRTTSVNFPVVSAVQASNQGGFEAFVTKFSPSGLALIWSTYLGGSGTDQGAGIAINSAGEVCLTGQTVSTDFPTVNPIQGAFGGTSDIYIAKLNSIGSTLLYSTYLGGGGSDVGNAAAFDSAGNCYVTGTAQTIPTVNAVQISNGGNADAFVVKLNPTGSTIVYSTYLGGSGYDFGVGIGVDSLGNAFVAGGAGSSDFPTPNAWQPASGGPFDGFVAKISDRPPDSIGPVSSNVVAAQNPVAVNTAILLTANIDDTSTGGSNIADAEYSFDGGAFVAMSATDLNFDSVSENVTANAILSTTGVHTLCVRGKDVVGNTGDAACILVPVYDPDGGFTTGGGTVQSPAGADLSNSSAAGLATFGFVSKYLPGRSTPDGNLEFQFQAGSLNFKSTSMDWLVVTGEPRSIFRGTGTINGANVCKFEVDAWDGSFQPGNVDGFGLKIFSCTGGGDRYSLPAKPLTKGSIIIHRR